MLPGQQHKIVSGVGVNPFEDQPVSHYTAQQISTLQAKLDQQLGPEFISSRAGPGGRKVYYIQSEKVINLANQVFGFNGWNSSLRSVDVDFLDQSKDGKWSIGVSVTLRVTLKDGTYHEDIGYGSMEGGKNKAQVFEKAKKEGTTDALKRTLRNFGNVLGNCLYDKGFLEKITKIRAPSAVFDENRLHRHGDEMPSHMPVKQEPNAAPAGNIITEPDPVKPEPETFDEYGGDEFEELGIFGADDLVFDDLMPDEVMGGDSHPTLDTPSKPGPGVSRQTGNQANNNFGRPQQAQPQQNHKPQIAPPSPTKQHSRAPSAQPPSHQQAPPPSISAALRPQSANQPQQSGPPPQAASRPVQRQQGPNNSNNNPNRPGQNMQPPGPHRPQGNGSRPQPVQQQNPQMGAPHNHNQNQNQNQTQTQNQNQRSHVGGPPSQNGNQNGNPNHRQNHNQQQSMDGTKPAYPTISNPHSKPTYPTPAPPAQGQTPPPVPPQPATPQPHNPPLGFYTGRAAMSLTSESDVIPDAAPVFNPHRVTTIPRSAGIDHSKSSPISRKVIEGTKPGFSPPNFQNPTLAPNRMIGAPPGRGAFRAPGQAAGAKRTSDGHNVAIVKTPLSTTPQPQLNQQNTGSDQKRPRNGN